MPSSDTVTIKECEKKKKRKLTSPTDDKVEKRMYFISASEAMGLLGSTGQKTQMFHKIGRM
jgi:hypothetical protein